MSEQPSRLDQTNLFDFLVKDDDITWQSILMDAVKEGNLDPWDIDIKQLSEQFLAMLQKLKEMNFSISGKLVLAAAILLKLKSSHFVQDDIAQLDRIIANMQQADEEDYDDTDYDDYGDEQVEYDPNDPARPAKEEEYTLHPRTPQPRRRKVSIQDLVSALDKALEVKNRRKVLLAKPAPPVQAPRKVVDVSELMTNMHGEVKKHYQEKDNQLMFSHLVPNEEEADAQRHAKMYTFIPLLHLSNAKLVGLEQESAFEDFKVHLRDGELVLQEVDASEPADS